MESFLGQIIAVGFNFPPNGWALCNGQLLPISQNSALFSLLGTMYGGNGVTNFALPDLRGRVVVGVGQGPGTSNINQGEMAGIPSLTLTASQIPPLPLMVSTSAGTLQAPVAGAYLAQSNQRDAQYVAASGAGTPVPLGGSISNGSQSVPVMQPYLGLNYCIALQGVFPSRN